MLDLSWGEIMLIGAVALIVIGPKELPAALRTVGQMVTKVRRMAGEFSSQFNEAMREAELDDVRKQVEGLNQTVAAATPVFNPMQSIRDELKTAIESPAKEPTPGETVATAAAQGRGEHASPVPVEPSIALPVGSVPPIVDPGQSIGDSVERAARAKPDPDPAMPAKAETAEIKA